MNKSELVDVIANETKLSKRDSESALNAALTAIATAVSQGDPVQLKGFGSFKRVDRAARDSRNPRTGDIVKVPAKQVAKAALTFLK